MKVFISVDIEGISGICFAAQTEHGRDEWRQARRLMRADLDAALAGCLAAGAEQIVVCDGHDLGDNLDPDGLPTHVSLISGAQRGLSMLTGLDASFDAVLLIGYHAMAGTAGAVLAHTYCSAFWELAIGVPGGASTAADGGDTFMPIGEVGLNAALAGVFGVPIVLVSGDDKLAAEVRALLPTAMTVEVKRGIERQAAQLVAPDVAAATIRLAAEQALRAERPAAVNWDGRPLRLTMATIDQADAVAACPGVRRLDGRRLLIESDDYLSTFRTFLLAANLVYA